MTVPARIKIGGADGEGDFFATGTLTREQSGIYINYGLEGDGTIIGISDDTVTLTKTGDTSYTLTLLTDSPTTAEMRTEFGPIPLTIRTEAINVDDRGDEVDVELIYTLGYADIGTTDFKLRITCTELKESDR